MSNQNNRHICYFYHRTPRYNVTVAYQRGEDDLLTYGAAFCRPEDQFVKRRGRQIALGRMHTQEHEVTAGPARWEAHEAILTELLQNREVDWVPHNFRS